MSFKNSAFSVLAIVALLVALPISSCSSGSSGPCVDAGHDLTGMWQLTGTFSSASSACDEDPGDGYDLIISGVQTGTTVILDYDGNEIVGTVCGDTLTYSYSFPGESGSGSFAVASNTSMSGTVNFTQDAGCVASVAVNAVRISPITTDDESNTAVVINERRDRGILAVMRARGDGAGRLIPLGYVEPGGAVVFPLPPGTWDVFTVYSDEGSAHYDYLGELGAWTTQSGAGRHAGGVSNRPE